MNGQGAGAAARVTATPRAASAPAAPVGLTAVTGFGQVMLAWTAPPYRGAAVTGYQYRQSADDGSTWEPDWTDVPGSGPDTVLHAVTGLTDGASYRFEVRATSGLGAGDAARTGAAMPGAEPSPVTVSFGFTPHLNQGWDALAREGEPGGAVTVRLSPVPGREVVIPITAHGLGGAPAGDWSLTPGASLTFTAAESAQSLTVVAARYRTFEPGQGVLLSFGALPAGVAAGSPASATVILQDSQAPPVEYSVEVPRQVREGDGDVRVTVIARSRSRPAAALFVETYTEDGSISGMRNYRPENRTEKFSEYIYSREGDWYVGREHYYIELVDDDRRDGDDTFRVVVRKKLGSPQAFIPAASPSTIVEGENVIATVTIVDDDDDYAAWALAAGPAEIAEAGGSATVTVSNARRHHAPIRSHRHARLRRHGDGGAGLPGHGPRRGGPPAAAVAALPAHPEGRPARGRRHRHGARRRRQRAR